MAADQAFDISTVAVVILTAVVAVVLLIALFSGRWSRRSNEQGTIGDHSLGGGVVPGPGEGGSDGNP